MGRYKKRGIAHYGIDYFKATIVTDEKSLLLTMSENSNLLYIDEETSVELMSDVSDKWKRYYAVRDVKTNIQLAFIGIGGIRMGSQQLRDFYEVTGQGLILRN